MCPEGLRPEIRVPQLGNGEPRKLAEEGRLGGLPHSRPRTEPSGDSRPGPRQQPVPTGARVGAVVGAKETREHGLEVEAGATPRGRTNSPRLGNFT